MRQKRVLRQQKGKFCRGNNLIFAIGRFRLLCQRGKKGTSNSVPKKKGETFMRIDTELLVQLKEMKQHRESYSEVIARLLKKQEALE